MISRVWTGPGFWARAQLFRAAELFHRRWTLDDDAGKITAALSFLGFGLTLRAHGARVAALINVIRTAAGPLDLRALGLAMSDFLDSENYHRIVFVCRHVRAMLDTRQRYTGTFHAYELSRAIEFGGKRARWIVLCADCASQPGGPIMKIDATGIMVRGDKGHQS